jgi:hypothetical protein
METRSAQHGACARCTTPADRCLFAACKQLIAVGPLGLQCHRSTQSRHIRDYQFFSCQSPAMSLLTMTNVAYSEHKPCLNTVRSFVWARRILRAPVMSNCSRLHDLIRFASTDLPRVCVCVCVCVCVVWCFTVCFFAVTAVLQSHCVVTPAVWLVGGMSMPVCLSTFGRLSRLPVRAHVVTACQPPGSSYLRRLFNYLRAREFPCLHERQTLDVRRALWLRFVLRAHAFIVAVYLSASLGNVHCPDSDMC